MAIELLNIFAVAAPGLEPIVERELRTLGEQPRRDVGGVSWQGDARSVMRANLWLRTATRVLVRASKFTAKSFAELERHAKKVPWSRFVAPGVDVEFAVTSRKSKLIHTGAIEQRLRAAIDGGRRKSVDAAPARSQLFVVRVVRDEFEISADTSGELLHMRGYRQAVGKAPLRETLAAALLYAATWSGDVALLDPFCGSGTIPIEAALIAREIAPGINRNFAFENWPGYDDAAWESLVADALKRIKPTSPVKLSGSDRDKGVLESARANAERAGVLGDIEFSQRAVSAIEAPATAGLIATNPPYGVRASPKHDVRDVYAALGNVVRNKLGGWRVAMYASEERFVKQTKLDLSAELHTSNGGIRIAAWMGTPTTAP